MANVPESHLAYRRHVEQFTVQPNARAEMVGPAWLSLRLIVMHRFSPVLCGNGTALKHQASNMLEVYSFAVGIYTGCDVEALSAGEGVNSGVNEPIETTITQHQSAIQNSRAL